MEDFEKTINDIYNHGLEEMPTFSEAMVEHMKESIEKSREEAREWVRKQNEAKN